MRQIGSRLDNQELKNDKAVSTNELQARVLPLLNNALPPYLEPSVEPDSGNPLGVLVKIGNSRFANKTLVEHQIEETLKATDVEYCVIWDN